MRAIVPPEFKDAAAAAHMSPAVAVGDLLFLTGMTGSGPTGAMPADPETQFRAVFSKIATILREADLTLAALADITSYHVDIDTHFETFDRVRRDHLTPPYPAWTAVEVARLRRQGALVEVRAIASRSALNAPVTTP